MKKTSCLLLLFWLCTFTCVAQAPVVYELDLSEIHHHELQITVRFADLKQDSLEIRMPNASPGRYALHQFAKNVYEERALTASGLRLGVSRQNPYAWKVPVENGAVIFQYTLFANRADGTYSGIDNRKVHLNAPASFVYGVGLDERRVEVRPNLTGRPGWSVATQLEHAGNGVYVAPNYYYFYDSPILIGELDWRRWQVDGQTIEVAMMHEGTDEELDSYTEWVKKIVRQQQAIYGELPRFDFGRYTFLVSYNPWVQGDGMEHRNSTVCTSVGNLAKNASGLIGTISHEFFHAWNIERLRPATLEPFDFQGPNLSGELWFGEGFTSYYDDLVLVRSGILAGADWVKGWSGTLNALYLAPGRAFRGPVAMSHQATFVDAGTSNDPTNYPNHFFSYYPYGQMIGLALDLSLRSEFRSLTLDHYMQALWRKYGKPEIPYTLADLESTLAQLTGSSQFASQFFEKYTYQGELPEYERLLASHGLKLQKANPSGIYLGNVRMDEKGKVMSPLLRGSALYVAGMNQGDVLLSLAGEPIRNTNDLIRVSKTLKAGSTYEVEYEQTGVRLKGAFTAVTDPSVEVLWVPDGEITDKKALERRRKWLEAR